MKLVYTHENRLLVLNVINILNDHQIKATINKEFASSAAGGLAPIDTWPEAWVLNNSDFDKAKRIIATLDIELDQSKWRCSDCQEYNDTTFEYCWNCYTEKK